MEKQKNKIAHKKRIIVSLQHKKIKAHWNNSNKSNNM